MRWLHGVSKCVLRLAQFRVGARNRAAWKTKRCTVPSETVAARHLAGEYKNTAATLQALCDYNRDVYMALPDHPVALGVPLPRSLLELHKECYETLQASIAKLHALAGGIEAWADDIERAIRDVVRQRRGLAHNRNSPC